MFEKAGFCRVSLLPRRAPGMPIELHMNGSGDPPDLLALQDEWYQDVIISDLGRLMREGIEWVGSLPDGGQARASLSGRELYVLGPHGDLNGFVSTPRLVLGEEHVVLCIPDRLEDVSAAIAETGGPAPALLKSDNGVPPGWVGLRGVIPHRPIAPSVDGDILDALRPLADVEIVLEGGIRIERQTWLDGFPPRIRLRGDTNAINTVTIDGREATVGSDGTYVVPGWDSPGEHSVWCMSGSRAYAIRSGTEEWEPWDAYTWSLGEFDTSRPESRPSICGVLVLPPQPARSDCRAVVVPASNPVLIGANPGEIITCTCRDDVRTGFCVVVTWFEPVWAIPVVVRGCDKRTSRVLLIGAPKPVAEPARQPRVHARRIRLDRDRRPRSRVWCRAILAASWKGLKTDPSSVEVAALWTAYKRYAKALRRSWR